MLARYEQTKPEDQQVAAAIKKRSRAGFRWGTTAKDASTLPPPPPSSSATRSGKRSSRSSAAARTRTPLPTLPPIAESELEGYSSDEDACQSSATSFASSTSSVAQPAGSHYSFSSPDSSFASTAPVTDPVPVARTSPSPSKRSIARAFMPRIEYNMRKLLREVMGRDSAWTSDHQVVRHYAHLNWDIVRIEADGNCLFRAISDQLYGSEIYHGDIRRRIIDFIRREGRTFQPFIATEASAESLAQYCERMQREGEWGGNPELYAAATLFNIHIVVHQGPMRRVRIENGRTGASKSSKSPSPPYKVLHLLFKDDHYNSLHPPPEKQEKAPIALKRTTHSAQHVEPERQPRSARGHELRQPEPSEPVVTPQSSGRVSKTTLGGGLHAYIEEADAGVIVSKPTRAVFWRGRQDRTSSISTASSSFSVGPSEYSRGGSSEFELSWQSPRRRSATTPTSAARSSRSSYSPRHADGAAGSTTPVLRAAVVDESLGARVAFPSRLQFTRGVQKPSKHAAVAC